ncbi:MAG: hypothetical protein ACREUQ_02530, partial [Burkholderiales bacterium]
MHNTAVAFPGAPRVSIAPPLPLALYVHIPWCVRKCPYCDFNSHEIRTTQADTAQIPEASAATSPRARSRPTRLRAASFGHFDPQALRSDIPEREYVAALIADLESALPAVWGRRLSSVFFGGGTPSLLSAHAVNEILSA